MRTNRPHEVGSQRRSSRQGFTLIEVLVALTVSALVVLGAGSLISVAADNAEIIRREAFESARAANAVVILRRLLRDVRTSEDPADHVGGDEGSVRFASWCDSPAGWKEPCSLTLAFRPASDRTDLVLITSADAMITLRSGLRDGRILYLSDAARGGRWLRYWGASINVPPALGVVVQEDALTDTLILRLGEASR